jgi:NAD(P)-dependent dehydrogenase (short-subunit alcohol dehydrogenase family)
MLAGEHPLKRLGTPKDIARPALILASDEAAWIIGISRDETRERAMV